MSYFYQDCDFRYLNKTDNQCIIDVVSTWWQEQIGEYGQRIDYYVNNHAISAQDSTYGEDTPATFSPPLSVIAVVDLTQSQMFARWALMGDDYTTMLIHISSFRATFGPTAEPKSGDVYQLTEFGSDRQEGRTGKMFQVTERLDEEITQINQLMGHYVWMIKAKRYEFSFEPGLSAEGVTDQVIDNTRFIRLSGFENPPTTNNYSGSAADQYSPSIFDYNNNGNLDDVYGIYR